MAAEVASSRFPRAFAGVVLDGTTPVVLVAGSARAADDLRAVLRREGLPDAQVRQVTYSLDELRALLIEVTAWTDEADLQTLVSGIDVQRNCVRLALGSPAAVAAAEARWSGRPVHIEEGHPLSS